MSSFINTNTLAITVIILVIAVIALTVALVIMRIKLQKFLIGIDSQNIKDSLGHIKNETEELKDFRNNMEEYLKSVEKRLKKSIQSVHTVRFNPFKGTGGGGNQSFATTMLNEEGDGVIISSLYSREHVSVFAKPIKGKKSEHELSDEEKESLEAAKSAL